MPELGLGLRAEAGAGNCTSQSFPSASPNPCLGSLEQGFPDSRTAGRKTKMLEMSFPVPSPGKGQRWKEPGLGTMHTAAQIEDWDSNSQPSSFSSSRDTHLVRVCYVPCAESTKVNQPGGAPALPVRMAEQPMEGRGVSKQAVSAV